MSQYISIHHLVQTGYCLCSVGPIHQKCTFCKHKQGGGEEDEEGTKKGQARLLSRVKFATLAFQTIPNCNSLPFTTQNMRIISLFSSHPPLLCRKLLVQLFQGVLITDCNIWGGNCLLPNAWD